MVNVKTGKTEQMTLEELAKKAIKIKVNTGDDGIVVLPIAEGDNCTIDWGDGTTTTANNNEENIKVASVKKTIKVAQSGPSGISHEYSEKGVNKTVTITGDVFYINTNYGNVTTDKIIEIEQWGETGLEEIHLAYCSNLTKIASPSEKSFVNITDFWGTFKHCTSLQSIPEGLFDNCPNVTDFRETFEGCTSLQSIPEGFFDNCTSVTEFIRTFHNCTSLQSIPEGLFDNCINVTDFLMTFANCTRLEGNAPNLWTRGTNSTENNYEGNPYGNGCFYECTGLTNYSDIPEFWKNLRNPD